MRIGLSAALAIVVAAAAAGAGAGARTVVDDLGARVTVPAAPLRIASLAPGATETLFAAGAGADVIATVEYSNAPDAARAVPRIGDTVAIDLERLAALHPDVVVVWPGGGNPAQRSKLAALGLPLYQQQVERLADLPGSVRRLGMLAGTQPVAEAEARALEARLAQLRTDYGARLARGGRGPTVLLQVWNRPIYTIGGRHLMSDALAVCGARNAFGDLAGAGPAVDIEAVIARDPDVILVAAPPGEGAAWVKDWQRFPMLAAVRTQRVVAFEDLAFSRLGPSVFDATAHLCATLAGLSRGSW